MAEHAGKPKVRFAGFTETWEQRNTSYLGNFFKGQGYSKADLLPDGTPIILYGQLYTNYQFTITEVNTYAQKKKNTILSKGNEVIVPASGETAEDIARASAVRKKGVILGGDLNIIVPIPSMNAEFFALSLSNGFPQKKLAQKAQGKSVVHIHNSDIQEISITYPSLEEQNRIASFFRHLDRLITLHQRKRGRLENIKKAMLEKMFPKNGADVPEVRFVGFTEAWEQRKFEKIAIRSSAMAVCSRSLPGVEYEDIISEQGILNKDIKTKRAVKIGIKFLPGDVLFGKLRPYLKNWLLPDFTGVAVGDFWVLQPSEIDSQYLYYLIQTPAFQEVSNQSTGTKMPRADWNLVANSMFFLPQNDDEQTCIGTFFRQLDRLITLHQRKVALLQNIKKACLEKMFV